MTAMTTKIQYPSITFTEQALIIFNIQSSDACWRKLVNKLIATLININS